MPTFLNYTTELIPWIFKKRKKQKKVKFFGLEDRVRELAAKYGYNYSSVSVTSIKYTYKNYEGIESFNEQLEFNLYASVFGSRFTSDRDSVQSKNSDPDIALAEFEKLCKEKEGTKETSVSEVIIEL